MYHAQLEQFDVGPKTYKAKLKLTTEEPIKDANRGNVRATSKNGERGKLLTAAMEITRRECTAKFSIHKQVADLLKEGKYGYAPGEKPDNCFWLMFENYKSLGIFTGQGK